MSEAVTETTTQTSGHGAEISNKLNPQTTEADVATTEGTTEGGEKESTGTTIATGAVETEAEKTAEASEQESEGKETEASEDTADGDKSSAEVKLSLPENSQLSEAELGEVNSLAHEAGLTQDQAEKVLEYVDVINDGNMKNALEIVQKHYSEEAENMSKEWRDKSLKHPEIGGDKISETAEQSKRVLEAIFPEGDTDFDFVREQIDASGLGNHVGFLRAMRKAYSAMNLGEDSVEKGTSFAQNKQNFLDTMYPTTAKNKD